MANHHGFASASLPIDPSLHIQLEEAVQEDEEDWEYEYSTTETESFYVTLDLTTPVASMQQRIRKKRGNAPGKIPWVIPPTGILNQADNKTTVTQNHGRDTEDAAQEPSDDGGKKKEERVKEIQILDIASDTPVVSYGGQVYTCRWEENIGTELLFTKHEPNDPLPVLRHLPEGVDLLAASSARIVSDEVRLQTKVQDRSQSPVIGPKSGLGGYIPDMKIPVGREASEQRKQQARFLEKMMALKMMKQETDAVTVVTNKRKSNGQWARAVMDERKKERARLEKSSNRGGKAATWARERLAEMDQEDAEKAIRGEPLTRPAAVGRVKRGRPSIRKPAVEPPAKLSTVFEQQQHGLVGDSAVESISNSSYGNALSIPTPRQWLEGEDEDGQRDAAAGTAHLGEMPAAGADTQYYNKGEEGLYDMDAPGEDDDTPMQYGW